MTQKLLYDLAATQPNVSGKRHGGGRYGEVVFRRMVEMGYKPVCCYDSTRWISPEITEFVKEHNLALYDITKTSLSEILSKEQITCIYSCLPSVELMTFKGCQVAVTLHGLRSLETPHDNTYWEYRNKRLRGIVRFLLEKYLPLIGIHWNKSRAEYRMFAENDHLVFCAVSEHTRASFLGFYPEYKHLNIPVFYSPSTSSPEPITECKYEDKYFLMVSGNRWGKNNLRAIKALDRLFSAGYLTDYKVRITGAKDANNYRYAIKNPERFIFMGYVDDHELEQLYHDAYTFIYPSLNEGFGYPPMEAMRYGVPVLASPYSSIPEVCQGAAIYFNPQSVDEIMNRILLITDADRHHRYSELARERYAIVTERQNKDLDKFIKLLYSNDLRQLGGGKIVIFRHPNIAILKTSVVTLYREERRAAA